jgi:hypothetical protein
MRYLDLLAELGLGAILFSLFSLLIIALLMGG